jgi:hypothetical protein
MFALCGNRTRDLLHSRRVFPSLPHIGRQYVFKTTTKLPLGILMQIFLMGRVIQEEGLKVRSWGRSLVTLDLKFKGGRPLSVQPTAHQTIHFGLCIALTSRALALISNCKHKARRAVDCTCQTCSCNGDTCVYCV